MDMMTTNISELFIVKLQVRFLSLVILACAEFLGGCTLSILAPFYSKVCLHNIC